MAVVAVVGCTGSTTGAVVAGDAPPTTVAVTAPDADGAAGGSGRAQVDDELADLLERIVAARRARDAGLLASTLVPDTGIAQRWLAQLEATRDLPLVDHDLRLGDGLGDLATDAVRAAHDGAVVVRWVVESFRLDGFDDAAGEHDLFLTFVQSAEGWRVASDGDAEALGLVSVDHLWDRGPVVLTGSPPLAVLHHPDAPAGATIAAVLDDARAALATVEERWPLAWPRRVPIVVPRDQDELAELLHVTFSLDDFVAFASSSVTGELGEYRLTAPRVVVNPGSFLRRSSAARRRILVHELLHVATRPVSGPLVPSWLDEGVAQALGERGSSTGTALLAAALREGQAGVLPADADFTVGGRDRIFLSYQQAWSFLAHLERRFGTETVARFYERVGTGGIGVAGTRDWVVDVAAREVLGEPLDALRAAWAAEGG